MTATAKKKMTLQEQIEWRKRKIAEKRAAAEKSKADKGASKASDPEKDK